MRPLICLYIKDLKHFFGDRGAVLLSFIVPAAMAILFGFTFGRGGGGVEELKINIDVVDNDKTEISQKIIDAVEENEILIPTVVSEEEAYDRVGSGKRSVGLIIPEGFGQKIENAEDVAIKVIYDPSDQLENGVVQGVLMEVIYTADIGEYLMPTMIERVLREAGESETSISIARSYIERYFVPRMSGSDQQETSDESENEGSSGSSIFSNFEEYPLTIESEQVAGEDVSSTAGYVQAIVSAMVMFVLFGISMGSSALLKEKKYGTLKRLVTSPLSIEGMLVGKLLSLMTVGLMQVYFMLIMGWLIFHLEIWSYPFQLFLMALGVTLMASGVGVMLTGIAKTEEQASMLSTLVILSMSAVGGAMVPRFIMPDIMRKIGAISPVSWAVDGFHNVFWYHQGLLGMLPQFGVLIGFSIVFLFIGTMLVKRHLRSV